ncbi:unnamed protein product [Diabrotica balteata]|uniref:Uncharacterized protein n=1 Tax=Diabrotica balteata TaxID=107213 RepID=A0A9N9T5A2_DIABA|nr:unnamed protein product [Diabrotica balteata]
MNSVICLTLFVIGVVLAGHGHDNAHYKFEYGVHDPHTHDHKSQHEHRHGHDVTGGYTLKEADGTHRVVKYKSSPHNGFEAVVERVGHAQHPAHYGHGVMVMVDTVELLVMLELLTGPTKEVKVDTDTDIKT